MRHRWVTILGLGAVLVHPGPGAQAGPNEHAVLVLHVSPGPDKATCEITGSLARHALTGAPLGAAVATLMVANTSPSSGVAGVQVGLTYDGTPHSGVDVEAWYPCVDFAYPDPGWPGANSGAMLLVDSAAGCFPDGAPRPLAVFFLRAHSPDRLALVAHPGRGTAAVLSCNGEEDTLTGNLPSPLGVLDFGGGQGYNPCSRIVPLDPATWGSIESLFARS